MYTSVKNDKIKLCGNCIPQIKHVDVYKSKRLTTQIKSLLLSRSF